MSSSAIDPPQLGSLAAAVGLSIEEANRTEISALLASIRSEVMRNADALPIESPPALIFNPR